MLFCNRAGGAASKVSVFGGIFGVLAKLCFAVVVLAVVFPPAPASAQPVVRFVSATGSGTLCDASAPCATLADTQTPNTKTVCLNGNEAGDGGLNETTSVDVLWDIDCPLGTVEGIQFHGTANVTLRVRHLAFKSQLTFQTHGTLILEDCEFVDSAITALDVEPVGPLNLVITHSRISNNSGGIILKPAAGGSITATLDHVTITNSGGGGIKVDTTNGPVTLDITDSVISKNGGNGINAIGNAGGQAIVSIKNSVIAKNGAAGVQANGVNAGVLLQTTLLDQNAAGATSVVSGGNMFTYGNNSVVGAAGSGFTATAGLQ